MDLFACAAARWTPGIGDPSAWGWIAVLAYALAAGACVLAARRMAGRERWFWAALSAGLLALAVNKQLDLQSGLTALARCHAQAAGWYQDRRGVQLAFIAGVGALAALGAGLGAWAVRARLRRLWPAVLGAALVLGFVAIRAAGFHHVDVAIGQGVLGVTVNAVLEVGGTALIGWGAVRATGGEARAVARR